MDVEILANLSKLKTFSPVPINPAQIEDLTFTLPPKTRIGDVIKLIINNSKLITNAELKDTYKDSFTFRVWYQDPEKTLTNEDVEKIRTSILEVVKLKLGGLVRE
jgi:phenylalanyl-tRNA synthetase beta chain